MIVRVIEIRDRHTYIPAVAMRMIPVSEVRHAGHATESMLARASLYRSVGFWSGGQVILMRLADQEAHADVYDWANSRTMQTAHKWLEESFDAVEDGQVVDVEFILGEKAESSKPQRLEETPL